MTKDFHLVHDGRELDISISDHLSTTPLPREVLTACVDTLSQAVINLTKAVAGFQAGETQEAIRALRQTVGMVEGMRRDLGMKPMIIDEP
jgi:hypothetical protein